MFLEIPLHGEGRAVLGSPAGCSEEQRGAAGLGWSSGVCPGAGGWVVPLGPAPCPRSWALAGRALCIRVARSVDVVGFSL